jgi:RimJ/RimL family protein N-acetyltransferase
MDAPSGQPTLLTGRLSLRPYLFADAPAVQRLAGAREVADTTTNIPHPYEDGLAEQWIASHPGELAAGRMLVCAVTDRGTDDLLGTVSLRFTPEHAQAELGYWIAVPFWGRGYATEASRALLEHGFATFGLHRVQARHFVRNPASGRVMQKLGMVYEGTLRQAIRKWGRFEDVALYGLLAAEWRRLHRPAR